MESTSQDLNSLISLLHSQRQIEDNEYMHRENASRIEANDKWNELQSLHDKQVQIKQNISKNLKCIVTQKHGLQKVIQGLELNTPKLPVTHKYQQDAIDLVSDAINFVNKFSDVYKSIEPENDIDTDKLCHEIITSGESVNQELNRSKTRLDQVETLRENTEMIKNQCFLSCDDNPE